MKPLTGWSLPENCDFMKVGNNSGTDNECTPILEDGMGRDGVGILINGPREQVWPKDFDDSDVFRHPDGSPVDSPLRLMVAGRFKLPYNTASLRGSFSYRVMLVAVNQDTGENYSGRMQPFGMVQEHPDIPSIEEGRENSYVGGPFNIDMVHNLGIPIADATYTVCATLGEFKSNVLNIRTRVE